MYCGRLSDNQFWPQWSSSHEKIVHVPSFLFESMLSDVPEVPSACQLTSNIGIRGGRNLGLYVVSHGWLLGHDRRGNRAGQTPIQPHNSVLPAINVKAARVNLVGCTEPLQGLSTVARDEPWKGLCCESIVFCPPPSSLHQQHIIFQNQGGWTATAF